MTLSEQLADYVVATSFDALPPEVISTAKRLIADTLACAWAGTKAPGTDGVRAMVVEDGGRPEATLWGFGGRVPAGPAAFLNGVSAAALDFDSLHIPGLAHSPIVILPAVMALAERQRSTGREFLAAFAVGVELHCRLGMATSQHKGWFYTSMHGIFAAAAASAKVLGLDKEQVCDAIGAALCQCAGTKQAAMEQTMMKRAQSAFAARNGVFSALLAQHGATAPRQAFEGDLGFYKLYEPADSQPVMQGLGKRFEILRLTMKKFPSCGCNHTPVEAVLRLMSEHKLKAEDIKDVEVVISPFMDQLVGAKYDPSGNAQVAAQFSVQYSIASAIMRGRLGLAEIEPDAARDPALVALAHRVRVIVDATRTGTGLESTLAMLTTAGRKLTMTVTHLPGSPESPMTYADLQAKALDCFAVGAAPLSTAQARALLARVDDLEALDDMSRFFSGLAGVPASERRSA